MLLFILLTIWQWCKSRSPESFENQKYFKVLVDGMRPKWICRSYFVAFLIRRTLFGAILFFCQSFEMITRVILFVVVQFMITVYMIVLKPQEELKERISDVINEIYYFFFGSFLLYFNSEDRWTNTTVDTYFWILMSNNFVLILIMLISSVFAYVKLCKRICQKKIKEKKVNKLATTPIENPEFSRTARNVINISLNANTSLRSSNLKVEMNKSSVNIRNISNRLLYVNRKSSMNKPQRLDSRVQTKTVMLEEIKE